MIFPRREAAAVATSALLLTLGACADGDVVRGAPEPGLAADESAEIDPLSNDPAAVEGDRVTITARVDELVHPNAFRIKHAIPTETAIS